MTRALRARTGALGSPAPVRGARRGPFVLLVTAMLLGTLAVLLTLNTLAAADELEQQNIADADAVTDARAQALQVDLAARRAPAALARAATALGMVPATQPAFLQIAADGTVTVLGTPGRVTAPAIPLTPPPAGSIALVPGTTTSTAPTAPATPTAATTAAATGTPTTTPATAPTTAPTATPSPTVTVTLPGGAR